MVTPGAKREAVAHAREHHGVSERRACALVGVSRRVIRYEPTRPDDGALRQRLRELAAELENIDAVLLKSEASRDRFRDQIVDFLVEGYSSGVTPLPCSTSRAR